MFIVQIFKDDILIFQKNIPENQIFYSRTGTKGSTCIVPFIVPFWGSNFLKKVLANLEVDYTPNIRFIKRRFHDQKKINFMHLS